MLNKGTARQFQWFGLLAGCSSTFTHMKKLFYAGLIALGIFEVAKVYFIMPMPGSQEMNTMILHTSCTPLVGGSGVSLAYHHSVPYLVMINNKTDRVGSCVSFVTYSEHERAID